MYSRLDLRRNNFTRRFLGVMILAGTGFTVTATEALGAMQAGGQTPVASPDGAWRILDADSLAAGALAAGPAAEQGALFALDVPEMSRAGLRPLKLHALSYDKPLCASLDGFTLHAATRAGGLDAEAREALLRYVLRGPRPGCALLRLRRSEWGSGPTASSPKGRLRAAHHPEEGLQGARSLPSGHGTVAQGQASRCSPRRVHGARA